MVVLATDHQVRGILWVQWRYNKGIGFLCGLKFLELYLFCEE